MPAPVEGAGCGAPPTLADAARRAPDIVASARDAWKGGRISPRARCVLADNPSPLTYLGTNTWILSEPGCARCVVVDPGPLLDAHLDAVRAAVADDGLEVALVALTHDHADHAEGARAFADAVGAPLLGRRAGTLPDGPLPLEDSALRLETVSLPGHSSDSVGFAFPADGSVVTGDFIFLQSSTLICWPDGNLGEYFDSLNALRRIVAEQGAKVLLTAHGLPIRDPLAAIDRQAAHRRRRLERVEAVIEDGAERDLELIMKRVYKDMDARLSPAARCNIQAQLAYLDELGER